MINVTMEVDIAGFKRVSMSAQVAIEGPSAEMFTHVTEQLRDRVQEAIEAPVPEGPRVVSSPESPTNPTPTPRPQKNISEEEAARIVEAAKEADRKKKADVRGFGEV